MKLSESTVKRVWMHWIKHHESIPIKKFGRKKKEIDEGSEELILKVHEEQKLGARRLEKIIEFKYGKHIPHNRIHQVLLKNRLAHENKWALGQNSHTSLPAPVRHRHPSPPDTPLFGYCAPQASGRVSVSFRESSRFPKRARQTGISPSN